MEARAVMDAAAEKRRERLEDFETLAIMSGIAGRAKKIPESGSMIKRPDHEAQQMSPEEAEKTKERLKGITAMFDDFNAKLEAGEIKQKRYI